MTRSLLRGAGAFALALALLSPLAAGTALAHERREVGKYTVVVGFLNEPALVDEFNGAYIKVTNTETKQPVEGVENSLQVEVTAAGRSTQLKLHPIRNQPGEYTADLIPTRVGQYVFRFTGNVEGQPVDQRFESGPGRFNDIASTSPLQFPDKAPSGADVARDLAASQSAAQEARTFAVFAIAGDVVLLLGLVALFVTRRRPAAGPRPSPSAVGADD